MNLIPQGQEAREGFERIGTFYLDGRYVTLYKRGSVLLTTWWDGVSAEVQSQRFDVLLDDI